MTTYDAIVIGTGGVGSAALLHLARHGVRVLGIERYGPAHDRGSSHGHTRLIRQAYFEHPDYVPLVLRAYPMWQELQHQVGRTLLHPNGLLEVGPADGVVVPGVLQSARQHGLEVQKMTAAESQARFPNFVTPEHFEAVYEPTAGILLVEDCVRAHLEQASHEGAELHYGETVVSWSIRGDSVLVSTDAQHYWTARLVVTAGAWTSRLLATLRARLRVIRKHQHWFQCGDAYWRQSNGCPSFFFELPTGCFYGIPDLGGGLKAAEHSGGEPVPDPSLLDQTVDEVERRRVLDFLSQCTRGGFRPKRHEVCMYTLTDDSHFVLDTLPAHPQVALLAGLSGHGFKFAPVLGEAVANLAMGRAQQAPVEFLAMSRWDDA